MKTKQVALVLSGLLALGSAAYGTWLLKQRIEADPVAKRDNLDKPGELDKGVGGRLEKEGDLDKGYGGRLGTDLSE